MLVYCKEISSLYNLRRTLSEDLLKATPKHRTAVCRFGDHLIVKFKAGTKLIPRPREKLDEDYPDEDKQVRAIEQLVYMFFYYEFFYYKH